jgi:uncharacterized protein
VQLSGQQLPAAQLSANAIRILGCLVEKELTVPDTYPMTINGLVTAANQSTSRFPLLTLTAQEVLAALNDLKTEHRMVRMIPSGAGSRVDKYRHVLEDRLGLSRPEKSVLAMLALRGPQTLAELRTRTNRMHDFADNAAVDRVLDRLCDPTLPADPDEPTDAKQSGMLHTAATAGAVVERPPGYLRDWSGPLAIRVPRQPGQNEPRVMHLLGGAVDMATLAIEGSAPNRSAGGAQGSGAGVSELTERVDALEGTVARLEAELRQLRSELGSN